MGNSPAVDLEKETIDEAGGFALIYKQQQAKRLVTYIEHFFEMNKTSSLIALFSAALKGRKARMRMCM